MNKAFKVLWNQVRGTYVVASEAQVTHGKPSKATKTIVAAAVAGLLAVGGVAQAEEILVDYDYVTQDQGTTKFISGNGNTLNIQTSANAQQMINEIKEALKADSTSEKLSGILCAIGTNNENMTAILTGTVGGLNYIDNTTNNIFGLVDLVESFDPSLSEDPKYGKLFQYAEKLDKQFENLETNLTVSGNTSIIIGNESGNSEPVLLATVGGDRVVNLDLSNGSSVNVPLSMDITRVGDIDIQAYSGNLFGLTAGNSAINFHGVTFSVLIPDGIPIFGGKTLDYVAEAKSTSTTLDGNIKVALDGHTNAAGSFFLAQLSP